MRYTLRPATADDRDGLFALRCATMRPYVEQTWHAWDATAQRALFEAALALTDMQVIVAGGGDAGLLHVERDADGIFLANIQIHPDFQNRGLGTAVIRTLLDEARTRGEPVRLQVLKVNHAACRLYQRLGFAITGETAHHVRLVWRPEGGIGGLGWGRLSEPA